MKLTDKGLIESFGKDEITEQDISGKFIYVKASDEPTNISELETLFATFPNTIPNISVQGKTMEDINKYLAILPQSKLTGLQILIDSDEIEIDGSQLKNFTSLSHFHITSLHNGRASVKSLYVPASVQFLHCYWLNDLQNVNSESDISQKSLFLHHTTKKTLETLSPKLASIVYSIDINQDDPSWEPSDISLLLSKLPKSTIIENMMYLDDRVPDLLVVDEAMKRVGKLDMSPDLLEDYKSYVEIHRRDSIGKSIFFSSSEAISGIYLGRLDQKSNYQRIHYPACDLANLQSFSKFNNPNVIYTFCAQNMTDLPLEVAQRLKAEEIKCEILMDSHDNGQNQNIAYSLDQYIQICQKMNEFIEDIDDSASDKEKLAQIYLRISRNIVYDYPVFYPKTEEDRKYSRENVNTSRNLVNGLLYGKCVCAGYADILKNACLLKGIECEYVQGPVDRIMSREAYIAEKCDDEILHEDGDTLIVRSYHAWNKIKIDGVWYNFDPTWDHDEISQLRAPKFTFLSDADMKKMGRPTCEYSRHPCTVTSREKVVSTFNGLNQPGQIYFYPEMFQQFEASLDTFGAPPRPSEISKTQGQTIENSGPPAVVKNSFWKKIVDRLKNFRDRLFNRNNKSIEDTQPLPVIKDVPEKDTKKEFNLDDTEPLPIIQNDQLLINQSPNKEQENDNPWKLTNEELQAVKVVENRTPEKKLEDNIKQDEIGDK